MSNGGEHECLGRVTPDAFIEVVRRIERQIAAGAQRLVNIPAALDRLDHDVELMQDLLGFYFADSPGLLADVQAAVAEGNADRVHRTAHRLKGLLSHFDARPAIDAAARLETMGRQAALEGAAEAAAQLHQEVKRVTVLLREFCPPKAEK